MPQSPEIDVDTPVTIVSNDTHVGPRLVEDLRPYCPAAYLDEFDRFAESTAEQRRAAESLLGGSGYLEHPNLRTPGHHDPAARLADYDHDGVAAGVLFHGSMNMEPIPFIPSSLGKSTPIPDYALAKVGYSIYNRWLADFVADDAAARPLEVVARELRDSDVRAVLESLPPRERAVIELRYGLGDVGPLTLEEIGKEVGLTRERVRQIEVQTLHMLRDSGRAGALRDSMDDPT